MESSELEKLIKSRRSIRSWQRKKVSRELLLKAIETATWAPNGANQQNYHFYLIMNKDKIDAVADAVQAGADRIAAWPEAANFIDPANFRARASYFRDAPALIAVTASRYHLAIDKLYSAHGKTDPEARRMLKWRNLSNIRIQSVAAAIAYLFLVLHQMGLGGAWLTSPMHAKKEIENLIRVKPGNDIIALIPVGYPVAAPAPGRRKEIEEVCDILS